MSVAFGGNPHDPRAQRASLFKDCGDIKGRWRGGRILGTAEIRYEDWPTTEEVIERGTDISDKVIRYLVAVSHYCIPLPKETAMCTFLLVWLALAYLVSTKPGWFGCLLVLLVIAILIAGCA